MTYTDEDLEALKLLDGMTWDEVEKIIGLPSFMHSGACYACGTDAPSIFHHGNYWSLAGRCMGNYDVGIRKQAERGLEFARFLKAREEPRERPNDNEANAALDRLTRWVKGADIFGALS